MDKEGVISTKRPLWLTGIATIQEMTSSEQWRYVATEDNPADFVSRGMDSLKLKNLLQHRENRGGISLEERDAKIGDMVIIKEDNLPSRQWSLGRIKQYSIQERDSK
ncbi:hypothetical protein TNCV_4214051, partial [Trichonephila clavipes]